MLRLGLDDGTKFEWRRLPIEWKLGQWNDTRRRQKLAIDVANLKNDAGPLHLSTAVPLLNRNPVTHDFLVQTKAKSSLCRLPTLTLASVSVFWASTILQCSQLCACGHHGIKIREDRVIEGGQIVRNEIRAGGEVGNGVVAEAGQADRPKAKRMTLRARSASLPGGSKELLIKPRP